MFHVEQAQENTPDTQIKQLILKSHSRRSGFLILVVLCGYPVCFSCACSTWNIIPYRPNFTSNTLTSAGETPGIRDA